MAEEKSILYFGDSLPIKNWQGKMAVPEILRELVERYREQRDDYRSPNYKQFRLRKEFIDPFFEALGWDMSNRNNYAEAYKDVIHEDSIKIAGASKAP